VFPVDYKIFPENFDFLCRADALFISMHVTPKSCGNLYKLPECEKKPGPLKPLNLNKSSNIELFQYEFTAFKLLSLDLSVIFINKTA
jgi:hypothetical protein